jgi:hypothetical protein
MSDSADQPATDLMKVVVRQYEQQAEESNHDGEAGTITGKALRLTSASSAAAFVSAVLAGAGGAVGAFTKDMPMEVQIAIIGLAAIALLVAGYVVRSDHRVRGEVTMNAANVVPWLLISSKSPASSVVLIPRTGELATASEHSGDGMQLVATLEARPPGKEPQ